MNLRPGNEAPSAHVPVWQIVWRGVEMAEALREELSNVLVVVGDDGQIPRVLPVLSEPIRCLPHYAVVPEAPAPRDGVGWQYYVQIPDLLNEPHLPVQLDEQRGPLASVAAQI